MKFDEHIPILDRGTAFPQFHGNAIPFGDRAKVWNPMDFGYYWWHHMKGETYEFGKTHSSDDCIEALMMGSEL